MEQEETGDVCGCESQNNEGAKGAVGKGEGREEELLRGSNKNHCQDGDVEPAKGYGKK